MAMQAKKKLSKINLKELTPAQKALINKEKQNEKADSWLTPIGINHRRRFSSRERILSIDSKEYLELLDWTGRMVKSGKKGAIPENLSPLFDRLEIDAKNWSNTVLFFGTLFCRVAGKASAIKQAAKDTGKKWLKGITAFIFLSYF